MQAAETKTADGIVQNVKMLPEKYFTRKGKNIFRESEDANDIERVVEGYEERIYSSNSDDDNKEDEAVEDKRRVEVPGKPKRVVKNPRVTLNPARLTGPRGIHLIPEHFKDLQFKGKGHEKEDLEVVLKRLQHWAYRLYPKFEFADCLKKIESLGRKRAVMVHLNKIRSDQFSQEETVVQKDSSDDEATQIAAPEDEFDKLLQQQIELARSTPAPGSANKATFRTHLHSEQDKRLPSAVTPRATSSPSINDEQRERMLRNRKLAEERRLSKLRQGAAISNEQNVHDITKNITLENPLINEGKKMENEVCNEKNGSKVIDNSDFGPNVIVDALVNSSSNENVNDNTVPEKVDSNEIKNGNDNADVMSLEQELTMNDSLIFTNKDNAVDKETVIDNKTERLDNDVHMCNTATEIMDIDSPIS